ncbi:MAG TPA: DUF2911 domain-containing protein [Blastocatellia bacterium]|nr:DUF2911 domain-containing protein [Blastocatellia bacterium]
MNRPKRVLFLLSIGALVCCCSAVSAQQQQPKVVAFGSDSPERGTTRVGYWDNVKNGGTGQFAIDYGRPVWKKDYEDAAKFDSMTKGQVWRLGSNFWTVLDTDMPIKISGKTIPVGSWYLGLKRSSDGSAWTLAFINPAKVKAALLDASEIGRAPVEFEAPMTFGKADETKDRLVIDLIIDKSNIYQPSLSIAWGNFKLSAPIQVPPRASQGS